MLAEGVGNGAAVVGEDDGDDERGGDGIQAGEEEEAGRRGSGGRPARWRGLRAAASNGEGRRGRHGGVRSPDPIWIGEEGESEWGVGRVGGLGFGFVGGDKEKWGEAGWACGRKGPACWAEAQWGAFSLSFSFLSSFSFLFSFYLFSFLFNFILNYVGIL